MKKNPDETNPRYSEHVLNTKINSWPLIKESEEFKLICRGNGISYRDSSCKIWKPDWWLSCFKSFSTILWNTNACLFVYLWKKIPSRCKSVSVILKCQVFGYCPYYNWFRFLLCWCGEYCVLPEETEFWSLFGILHNEIPRLNVSKFITTYSCYRRRLFSSCSLISKCL